MRTKQQLKPPEQQPTPESAAHEQTPTVSADLAVEATQHTLPAPGDVTSLNIPLLQRTIGNRSVGKLLQRRSATKKPIVQRKIGDGHDLAAARFAGDPVLEACLDNEQLLAVGASGSAVTKLQQALVDAGFQLPKFGVDGQFGSETKTAVIEFQKSSGFTGADIDGIVGPQTMGALDAKYATGPTPPGPTPPGPTPPGPTPPGPTPPGPTPPGPTPPGPTPPGPTPPGPTPPGPTPPGPTPGGLSYEEAKEKIKAAAEGWGTDEGGIYGAIRDCAERGKLKADPEVQDILKDELSGHDLWKAHLLLEYGSESAYPPAIQEVWAATEGWGTDEERIYKALQKLSEAEIQAIRDVPGLRDILNDELSGKDLKATDDLLSGDYAKAIDRHKQNVAEMNRLITGMRAGSLVERNTAEWIMPTQPGQQPKNILHVATLTHDAEARAKEHGHDDTMRAYFGSDPAFPSNAGDYDSHIGSTRNLRFVKNRTGGHHLDKDIWIYEPLSQGTGSVTVLVHEVQHDADRHDDEAGHDAGTAPEERWNRYKTEFRSYWVDNRYSGESDAQNPGIAPWHNDRQKKIYDNMVASKLYPWLQENYDKNATVDGQKFQDLVHGYIKPEGVNLINSPNIDNLYLKLKECTKRDTDLTQPKLKELEAFANALNADDRAYVNSADAKRLQDLVNANLAEPDVLDHISKIMNGGTKPAWAK